ncbi:hypothetical protein IWZ00DRAFT_243591 [Phyllosticta capitalensis]
MACWLVVGFSARHSAALLVMLGGDRWTMGLTVGIVGCWRWDWACGLRLIFLSQRLSTTDFGFQAWSGMLRFLLFIADFFKRGFGNYLLGAGCKSMACSSSLVPQGVSRDDRQETAIASKCRITLLRHHPLLGLRESIMAQSGVFHRPLPPTASTHSTNLHCARAISKRGPARRQASVRYISRGSRLGSLRWPLSVGCSVSCRPYRAATRCGKCQSLNQGALDDKGRCWSARGNKVRKAK